MVLPLAAAVCHHHLDLDLVARDRPLLEQTMRAAGQGLDAVHRAGFPILPRGLHLVRWIPAAIGARRAASVLSSDFGRIALAGHAAAAREEMHALAQDLLAIAEADAPDLRRALSTL